MQTDTHTPKLFRLTSEQWAHCQQPLDGIAAERWKDLWGEEQWWYSRHTEINILKSSLLSIHVDLSAWGLCIKFILAKMAKLSIGQAHQQTRNKAKSVRKTDKRDSSVIKATCGGCRGKLFWYMVIQRHSWVFQSLRICAKWCMWPQTQTTMLNILWNKGLGQINP